MPANRFELLAAWYLRFNGYFTIANFTVHPDYRKQPGGTDADVLAVRFPHSEEYQLRYNFERDSNFVRQDRVDFLICEVKAGQCCINANTWRDPGRENVEYALRWMGFEPDNEHIKRIAMEMYAKGVWEASDDRVSARFVCFGSKANPELTEQLPGIQEILYPQVIGFLRRRFCTGCHQISRENWEEEIIEFAELCKSQSDDQLIEWARQGIGQPAAPADRVQSFASRPSVPGG